MCSLQLVSPACGKCSSNYIQNMMSQRDVQSWSRSIWAWQILDKTVSIFQSIAGLPPSMKKIFFKVLIFIPFGVGHKESAFIYAFTNIWCFEFGFMRKSDWNIVLHPLIVYVSKVCFSVCCSEYMISMVNFKNISAKEFAASHFV